jgi:hypothetical protein
MCRKCPTSIGTLCYKFRLLYGISGDDIDISDSNEDDIDTGHGSLAAAGTKKRKTLPPSNCKMLSAPTQEALIAPAIGFSDTWAMDTDTIPSESPISVSIKSIRYSIEWSPRRTCIATRRRKAFRCSWMQSQHRHGRMCLDHKLMLL